MKGPEGRDCPLGRGPSLNLTQEKAGWGQRRRPDWLGQSERT